MKIRTWCLETIPIRTYSTSSHSNLVKRTYCPKPPILLSEVEQEQRPSGNEDREAIVVGAGLCDGEGERVYNKYASFCKATIWRRTFRRQRKSLKRPRPFWRSVDCHRKLRIPTFRHF